MNPILLDLSIVAVFWAFGLAATWRLIWPKWKIVGKSVAFFGLVALGSWLIGHWVLLLALAHQGLGLGVHIWFSRRNGFTWYAVEDPERYVELSKQMVGYVDEPEPREVRETPELPDLWTMQCEGEPPPARELFVDEEG